MLQSSIGLAHYGETLRNTYRGTSTDATAHELRAQVFRASLVSNPLGQPVRFDTDTPAVPQSKR